MPCYDPETHDRPIRLEAKVQRLTRLLCYLCQNSSEGVIAGNEDLASWWKAHQESDAKIARLKEKKKTHGESALTPQELGVLYFAGDVSMDEKTTPSVRIINPR